MGALHNGAAVFVSDLILDGSGRRWAKIVPIEEGKSGWVFREYLMCTSASVPTDRVQAESALDRYCRQAGVTKAEPCVEVARDCGKPTEYAMVADRTCMAADIVTCWNCGLRPGAKLMPAWTSKRAIAPLANRLRARANRKARHRCLRLRAAAW